MLHSLTTQALVMIAIGGTVFGITLYRATTRPSTDKDISPRYRAPLMASTLLSGAGLLLLILAAVGWVMAQIVSAMGGAP